MSGVPWGGSEELWWKTARWLQNQGHEIRVNFKWWPEPAWHLKKLAEHGAELHFRDPPQPAASFWRDPLGWLRSPPTNGHPPAAPAWTATARPEVVLVTLGYHPDRIPVADECIDAGIPYAINVQSASNFFFIHSDCVDQYRRWYREARRVFFVSEENRHKVETNLAMRLDNAEIVANPFNIDRELEVDWPAEDGVFRLGCVGRIHFQSKGQDLIIDVLRQDKWRNRPLEVHFFGHDQGNLRQLTDLIAMYGLEGQLKIRGFERDVARIWQQCHGMLLPSRYEGAALVVVEAMLCRRMPVTTDTGRNSELIDDGVSGFIALAASVEMLDQALERAWQARADWQAMGELAGRHIRERYPADPIAEFAQRIKSLVPVPRPAALPAPSAR